jgi:hypothetical protein
LENGTLQRKRTYKSRISFAAVGALVAAGWEDPNSTGQAQKAAAVTAYLLMIVAVAGTTATTATAAAATTAATTAASLNLSRSGNGNNSQSEGGEKSSGLHFDCREEVGSLWKDEMRGLIRYLGGLGALRMWWIVVSWISRVKVGVKVVYIDEAEHDQYKFMFKFMFIVD